MLIDIFFGVDVLLSHQLEINNQKLIITIANITWGSYFKDPILDTSEIFVCHTPFTGSTGGMDQNKLISDLKKAAKEQGVDLGDVQSDKFSCRGTNVKFQTMLQEVKTWLDSNPEEFVILVGLRNIFQELTLAMEKIGFSYCNFF